MGVSKAPIAALRDWIVTGEAPAVDPNLAAGATEQGLAGLLLADLRPHPAVAPVVLAALREAARQSLFRGVRLLDLAGRAQRVLLDRGLRALPLKGAALAEPLYDSVGLRPMLDADLLALDAWPAAIEALLVEGYRAAVRADHSVALVCPDTGGILELHGSVTSCPGLFPFSANGTWSRSLPGEGPISRLPSAEDLLVHLCLHASFQHGLVLSLVQWLDFRRLLERRALDVRRVIEITREAGAEAAVAVSLRAAAAVVRAPLPIELMRALVPPAPRLARWLAARLRDPLHFVAPAAPALARLRFELTRGRRARFLAATLRPAGATRCGPRAFGSRAVDLARRYAVPTALSWFGARP